MMGVRSGPFQGQAGEPGSFHERTNNERVLPDTVDLAQPQQARGIQRLPGRDQHPGFDHQIQVNDHEFSDRPWSASSDATFGTVQR
jgi:hypothetical protein